VGGLGLDRQGEEGRRRRRRRRRRRNVYSGEEEEEVFGGSLAGCFLCYSFAERSGTFCIIC